MKRVVWVTGLAGVLVLCAGGACVVPRLMDRTSPRLFVRNIYENGSYNESFEVELEARDKGGRLSQYSVELDGVAIAGRQLSEKSLLSRESVFSGNVAEGRHRLEVIVSDNALPPNKARKVFILHYDTTPPEAVCRTADHTLFQGGVLALDFAAPGERAWEIAVSYNENTLPCYPLRMWPGVYRVLVPAGGMEQTRAGDLKVIATDAAGNTKDSYFHIDIKRRYFPSETILLNSAKSGLLTDADAITRTRERMVAAFSSSADRKLWQGKFMRPTEGVISSEFGTRRVYNDGVVYSFHKGLDLANRQGTPIYAAASGRIVLAEELPLYGNSVVIDHGLGVFSLYYHMHGLHTQAGIPVKQGDLLGIMGTTGISTGNHLHWEIKVRGVSVRPQEWEEHEF